MEPVHSTHEQDITIDSAPTLPLHPPTIGDGVDGIDVGDAGSTATAAGDQRSLTTGPTVAAVTAATAVAMSSDSNATSTPATPSPATAHRIPAVETDEDQGQPTSRQESSPTLTDASSTPASSITIEAGSSSEDHCSLTPTQETANPVFVATTTVHDGSLDDSSPSSSPQPDTPNGPHSPITPNDESRVSRDSLCSIALSESSLEPDPLSTEGSDHDDSDILATPRVSGVRRHLRKVSSLDILQNKFPTRERPSTLFDTDDESMQLPMSATDLRETDKDDIWRRDVGEMNCYRDERRTTNTTLDSIDLLDPGLTPSTDRSRCSSVDNRSSDSSEEGLPVNWQALDKNEEQEKEDKELPEGTEDESTAFLLARLEQENAKFAADPKAAANRQARRSRSYSRPPSMAQLKRLVRNQDTPSIRYSLATSPVLPQEPPPMTELEFWVALVQDYPSTAKRLPTLTTAKVRSGIPPPLRGVVWTSIAGARDKELEDAYDRLVGERSPYEGIINKDVGRSFPGVELFRDADGEGQQMLGRVLKCFSLYDKDIGYCQGLGFLVGPLLMNMGERDSFCVLVRLMDHFSLRHSFLPSLSGLHMRIYQFSALLKQHHPKLHAHLAEHGIEPAYLSQWFLSCFAVTCPLAMLFRIYDVIFAEGANETVMRVALALMRRHEEKMLATNEFEEIMQLLLGREMWDCYGGDADVMVDDFTSLGDIVTNARLAELQKEFETQSSETVGQSAGFLPDVQAAAGRFLGRLWAPGHGHTPSKPTAHAANPSTASVTSLSPESADKAPSRGFFGGRPTSFLRRNPSKQDLVNGQDSSSSEDSASTTGSGVASSASTIITEPETPTARPDCTVRESLADSASTKSRQDSFFPTSASLLASQQQDLHAQIEDLLLAIGEMQREHAQMAALLQREREDRGEDQKIMRQMVNKLRKDKDDRRRTMPPPQKKMELTTPQTRCRPLSVGDHAEVNLSGAKEEISQKDELDELVEKAQERLQTNVRFSTSLETKAQLRSTLARTREQLAIAESQSRDLAIRLEASEAAVVAVQDESEDIRAEVKELRQRVNDDFKARQKLEHQLGELKAQARSVERKGQLARAESLQEVPVVGKGSSDRRSRKASVSSMPAGSSSGLRELKLGRRESASSVQSLGRLSRRPSPSATELAPPSARAGSVSPEFSAGTSPSNVSPTEPPSAPSVAAAVDKLTSNHRRGFSQRTSSLATQEIFASETHEAVPEEALLMELVNAKTSEAQARQELDEVKKALSVARRTQEETLVQMRAELEATKSEALRAVQAANAARSETEAVRLSGLGVASPLFSLPSTPHVENHNPMAPRGEATPEEEKSQGDLHVAKKTEEKPAPAAAGGGWFWQRRTASRTTNAVPEEAK